MFTVLFGCQQVNEILTAEFALKQVILTVVNLFLIDTNVGITI